jgi:hypothetical protein
MPGTLISGFLYNSSRSRGWTNCYGPEESRQGGASSAWVPISNKVRPARLSLNLQILNELGRLDGFARSTFGTFGCCGGWFLLCMRQNTR